MQIVALKHIKLKLWYGLLKMLMVTVCFPVIFWTGLMNVNLSTNGFISNFLPKGDSTRSFIGDLTGIRSFPAHILDQNQKLIHFRGCRAFWGG